MEWTAKELWFDSGLSLTMRFCILKNVHLASYCMGSLADFLGGKVAAA
jgi:hypothetical protein